LELPVRQPGHEQLRETLDGIHVLADLRALEEMGAVQAGAQDKMPLQQGLGPGENVEYFLLGRIHAGATLRGTPAKNKIFFAPARKKCTLDPF
jgi:hypothetical protein